MCLILYGSDPVKYKYEYPVAKLKLKSIAILNLILSDQVLSVASDDGACDYNAHAPALLGADDYGLLHSDSDVAPQYFSELDGLVARARAAVQEGRSAAGGAVRARSTQKLQVVLYARSRRPWRAIPQLVQRADESKEAFAARTR